MTLVEVVVQLAGLLGLTVFPILHGYLQHWLNYRWIFSLTLICGITASALVFSACALLGTPFAPIVLFVAATLASPIHNVGLRALGDNVCDYEAVEQAHSVFGLAGTAVACLLAIVQVIQHLPSAALLLVIAFASLSKQSAVLITRLCEAQVRTRFQVQRDGVGMLSVGIVIVLGDAIFWIAHLVSASVIIVPNPNSQPYGAAILLLPLIAYCAFLRFGRWLWARAVIPTAIVIVGLSCLLIATIKLPSVAILASLLTAVILIARGIFIDAYNSALRDFQKGRSNSNWIEVGLTVIPPLSLWLGLSIISYFPWFAIIAGVWLLAAGVIFVRTSAAFVRASELCLPSRDS